MLDSSRNDVMSSETLQMDREWMVRVCNCNPGCINVEPVRILIIHKFTAKLLYEPSAGGNLCREM